MAKAKLKTVGSVRKNLAKESIYEYLHNLVCFVFVKLAWSVLPLLVFGMKKVMNYGKYLL